MSVKNRFRGLTFGYKYEEKSMCDKYKTIEELLEKDFTKINNPLAPNLTTEIYNIRWNRNIVSINNNVNTLGDLVYMLRNDVKITNSDIKLKNVPQYERKDIYSIEYIESILKDIVLQNVNTPKKIRLNNGERTAITVNIDGEEIYALSDRYKLFFTKGYSCVECGLTGKYFALEKSAGDKRYHLNLYGVNNTGDEVLMTKDHIFPKSKGGKDRIENYQTMCCRCNENKGSNVI